MSEEICEMSDLPVSQCGMPCHRPEEKRPVAPKRTGFRTGTGIEAQIETICRGCGENIEVGDLIAKSSVYDIYVHKECA